MTPIACAKAAAEKAAAEKVAPAETEDEKAAIGHAHRS